MLTRLRQRDLDPKRLIMDRESFLEIVRKQYAEKINSAYVECEERGKIDWTKLNAKIDKLYAHAKIEGLPQKDFEDLVKGVLPEMFDKVALLNKKAA